MLSVISWRLKLLFNLVLSEGWTWWTGCLDHPPTIQDSCLPRRRFPSKTHALCCCILGTGQDLLEPPASSHLMRELPKATVVIADPFRSGCLSTVSYSGVSPTLAAEHRGHSSPPKRVAKSANVPPWLLRLALNPSSPTTWATRDARAVVDNYERRARAASRVSEQQPPRLRSSNKMPKQSSWPDALDLDCMD